MSNMVRQNAQQPAQQPVAETLPQEILEYINSARQQSADLHGDFQEGETPEAMMARMNAPLATAATKTRKKKPMVRQQATTSVAVDEPIHEPFVEPQQPAQQPLRAATPVPETTVVQNSAEVKDTAMRRQFVPPQPDTVQDYPQVQQVAKPSVQETESRPHVDIIRQVDNSASHDMNAPRRDYDAFSLVTGLPSRGVAYGNKVYGQSLSLIDILLLEGATEYDTVDVFDEILSRRIKGIDPGEILWCDEAYIFQWLRISSFPDLGIPYTRGFECGECGFIENSPDYQISFKNMDFRMNADPEKVVSSMPNGYYAFNFSDGRECNVYLRRRRHDRVIQKWLNDYVKVNGQSPKRAYLHLSAVAAILEIEGCQTHDDKLRYLSNMKRREDFMLLTSSVNEHSLTAENHVVHVCPKCGAKVDTVYPFRTEEYVSNL